MNNNKMITIYKVIFKNDKVHDIRPINIINDNELYNINDYKTIKQVADLLKCDYIHLTRKIIDNTLNDINLDYIFNNINKYLLFNQYIIIKDRL